MTFPALSLLLALDARAACSPTLPLTDLVDCLAEELADLQADAVTVLDADLVIAVPADEPTIDAALLSLDDKRLASGVTATIEVAHGTYPVSAPIVPTHPDGGRIRIVGDPAVPSAVQLVFTGTSGLVLDNGDALGSISGFRLVGDGTPGQCALCVSSGSYVGASFLEIDGFDRGVMVRGASHVEGTELHVEDTVRDGFFALVNGSLQADASTIAGSGTNGVVGESGGVVVMPAGRVDAPGSFAAIFRTGSHFIAPSFEAADGPYSGVVVHEGGLAYMPGSSLDDFTGRGSA